MKTEYDAIIVLGYGLDKEDRIPKQLRSRLDIAVELYRNKVASKLVMLGGLTNPRVEITEAEAMKRYALKKGIPEKDIIKEETSTDTIGNAFFMKKDILKPRKWHKLIVVTSDFHLERTRYTFKKIMGKGYRLKFIRSRAFEFKTFLYRIFGYERDFMKITKSFFKDVKPGDDKRIKKLLEIHPLYSSDPKVLELSNEEISESFGIDIRLVKKYRKYIERRFERLRGIKTNEKQKE